VARRTLACLAAVLVWTSAALWGCARITIPEPPVKVPKDYTRPLPPGAPALRKITDPARLPDFRSAFREGTRESLLAALDQSIRYFGYPSSRRYFPIQGITHERAAASLIAFREILLSARSGDELHQRILGAFDVYESVGCDNRGTVLFTGYYTPIFDASLTPTDEFRWPLYRLPPDLVKDEEGNCLGRRLSDGTLGPYYTRAEIESGALKGQELVYLKDRFEAYICTVQGSARLRLPDGSWFDVGYHGNNGHPYTSVGRLLVAAGLLAPERLTLSGLMQFFKQRPDLMDEYLPRNERTVFFRETSGPPTGSLGLPVTPYRTLATDKSIFPRGCLTFVETHIPRPNPDGSLTRVPFRDFLLDQDTGGAIRAAGRADIYLGIGEEAGRIAGWTFSEGRLYYLFLKEGGESGP